MNTINSAWIFLLLAGVFELGFTTFLKLADNFTRIPCVIGFLICSLVSFLCLSKSIQIIPIGTAYAVWTGLGAFGTALIGMWFFHEPASGLRIFLLLTLIASVVGLKFA